MSSNETNLEWCKECSRPYRLGEHTHGNDLATNHSDATTEPFKAAPSPTIDTELDTILNDYVIHGIRKPCKDDHYKIAQLNRRIREIIERETARARYDEAHISLGMNEGSQSAQLDRIAKLRTALTSPHGRKDDK